MICDDIHNDVQAYDPHVGLQFSANSGGADQLER